jgi:superfamily II DNA or RNA helicase
MKYPNLKKKKFISLTAKKFNEFKIKKKEKKTFKDICFPIKYELQKQQKFLGEYINPKTPYRDLLIYHGIGTGKTCTSINIAEQWKNTHKIIVVTPASLVNNYKKELLTQCAKESYITNQERNLLKMYNPSNIKYKRIIKKAFKEIEKKYLIISYNKFITLLSKKKINLRNKVLIIDEVQNIVNAKGMMYNYFKKRLEFLPKETPLILLSATPIFDKPIELALTMNLLRLPEKFPISRNFNKTFLDKKKKIINKDLIKKLTTGYISYFTADNRAFAKTKTNIVNCKMTPFQYSSYLAVEHGEGTKKESNLLDIPNDFYINTRLISNIAFPNKRQGIKGLNSLENELNKKKQKSDIMLLLKRLSTKFYKLIKNITKEKGLSFIFSNFVRFSGIDSLILILDNLGYKNYYKFGAGKNRYALWTGDIKMNKRIEAKTVFNQYKNKNGDFIKIFIGSPSIKEGVSLYRIRNIHILEPYWNMKFIDQVIGRGVRFCSHKDMPKKERFINIYFYLSTYNKKKQTVDQYIYDLAKKKEKLIDKFEKIIKSCSLDCKLFNQQTKIKCANF